jgi:O2-independent ubiquinone biosynthesis protein UbiU
MHPGARRNTRRGARRGRRMVRPDMQGPIPELVCPAGTPAALRAAVEAGADVVYLGFRDATNARNFPGLNFDEAEFRDGVGFAHARGCKVYVAINTFPPAGQPGPWHAAVNRAADGGADAVILADVGLLDYAATRHPDLRRHLSVQASASNAAAIRFFQDAFGVARVVLPRVLTLTEISALNRQVTVETEVFTFGGLCVMAEGRCSLSSYATGQSPNTNGVCSPASHVHYERHDGNLVSSLGDFTIDRVADGMPAGYPTLCKGRFAAGGCSGHLFEEPTSLDALGMLPKLIETGARALKIEGRQRGRAYVTRVVGAYRKALDTLAKGETPIPDSTLDALTEGQRKTTGAYMKAWQ